MRRNGPPVEDRFWAKVDKSGDCWLWTAGTMPRGYGMFTPHGRGSQTYAHRFSYELVNGPVPEGMVVRHTCDVRNCVNPSHLDVGTQADNLRDMKERGRSIKGKRLVNGRMT